MHRSYSGVRSSSAFTLIEVLVVVAIISLLVSVLLPSLTKARDRARAVVCLSNLHRLGHATVFYTNTYKVHPPFRLQKVLNRSTGMWADYTNRYGRKGPRWQWFMDYGVGAVINAGGVAAGSDEMTNDLFLCPSLKGAYERNIRNGAYGYNYQYLGNSRESSIPGEYANWPVGMGRIKAPGRTVLIGDSRGAGISHGQHSYTLDPPRLAIEVGATKFGPGVSDAGGRADLAYSPVEGRHNGRGNVAFTDGHARAMLPRELGYAIDPQDNIARPAEDPVASNALWTGKGHDPARTTAR